MNESMSTVIEFSLLIMDDTFIYTSFYKEVDDECLLQS